MLTLDPPFDRESARSIAARRLCMRNVGERYRALQACPVTSCLSIGVQNAD